MLWLTGQPGAPPLWPRAGLFEGLDRVATRIVRAATSVGRTVDLDVSQLLTGRAALMGLTRRGHISAGGACRLLPAADGWVAISLARPEDAELVPAITGTSFTGTSATTGADSDRAWASLARYASVRPAHEVMTRAQLLGVPVAVVAVDRPEGGAGADNAEPAVVFTGRPAPHRRGEPFTVVDLSSLWAGPLCAKVLSDVGARVIKVESRNRPDGGRIGCPSFFDWLHADHQSVVLDFGSRSDLSLLRALIARADVVIEASRPARSGGAGYRRRGRRWQFAGHHLAQHHRVRPTGP